jgi:F-box-like
MYSSSTSAFFLVISFVILMYNMLTETIAEEILLYVLSLLDTADLQNSCLVSTVWRRLCEDEFMYPLSCHQ